MTVRTAELLMGLALAVLSAYFMWKSAELPIGWIPNVGPGGGAWPFWLSFFMLLCCAVTAVRWVLRKTPESRSSEKFLDRATLQINAITVGSLVVMLILTHLIGMYFAFFFFLLFYLRFVGRHTWLLSGSLSVGFPVGLFFFFEALLKIILPKGYSEPLFYPLYDLIY